jgi:hypothetical protein
VNTLDDKREEVPHDLVEFFRLESVLSHGQLADDVGKHVVNGIACGGWVAVVEIQRSSVSISNLVMSGNMMTTVL